MEDKRISNKQVLIIAIVIIALIGGVYSLVKKKGSSDDNVLDNAQKTLEEQEGEEEDISYDRTIIEGEVVDIEFRFRDYKDVPDDPETVQETIDTLIPVKGNVSFEIMELGRTDKADNFHQAGEGKELYYVLYNFKGSEDNSDSLTLHPMSISETGWDPAPQFVMIENGEYDYASSSYRRPLLQSLGYDASLSGPDFNEEEVCAAVWKVDEGTTPELALKYIDMEGDVHYLKVEE